MKRILVTGSGGFIGKNLICKLQELIKTGIDLEIYTYDLNNTEEQLIEYLGKAEYIYHLAGINRPKNEEEFKKGNTDFTQKIINVLSNNEKKTTIAITSSIQAELENAYGVSKKGAEDALLEYGETKDAKVFIYRLPNVFGKWCRPNYNSAVATFCNNIAIGEEVWVSDKEKEMTLVYIDDVVRCLVNDMLNESNIEAGYKRIDVEHKATLGNIVELLNSFKESRDNLLVPDMSDEFIKKLYSTYLSYLPEDKFSYPLKMNVDNRGSFTEFLKSSERGQVSVNISKPGITKGNHWHHTKNEKFLVVSGEGIIKFRKINSEEVIEYKVSGEKLEVVDIPVGYTHNIINTGDRDMVTVMWVNEIFDPNTPDTVFLEV